MTLTKHPFVLSGDWTSSSVAIPVNPTLCGREHEHSASIANYITWEMATEDKLGSAYFRLGSAAEFIGNFSALGEEREVLRDAVKNLWRVYRFNQHYIGFLAGGVSEEEFNATAEKYAQTPREMSAVWLKNAASFVLPLIRDEELTPKDLAVVLNVDDAQLELALG